MEKSPGEIIDRLSIVKLKIERFGNPESQKEFTVLCEAADEFKERGIRIEDEWINKLYEINKEEWDLLDAMNVERKKDNCDLAKIGELYLETEKVNKKRAMMINMIVEKTGQGFKEIKKNHPSE